MIRPKNKIWMMDTMDMNSTCHVVHIQDKQLPLPQIDVPLLALCIEP